MTLTPELLLDTAVRRMLTSRPELVAECDLSSPAGLAAVRNSLNEADELAVVSVIRSVDLPGWVRETCLFALSLDEATARAWRRSFTRTIFLAGQPGNLRERFALTRVAPDGSVAWVGPAPVAATRTLRRLLKTFVADRPVDAAPPTVVELPTPGGRAARHALHRDLYLAVSGHTVGETLIQLNHLLVEAVQDGLINGGDRLTLRHVPRLNGLRAPVEALRVDIDHDNPDRLRAYAALTEPLPQR
ncbi:DUF6182 family protein [Planotetraspora sp. A-T 1434]|uniref:DUF6182 family protein n=1 Tax=Planotetraspora sp. A-T 1434 TaxID=2979219 RepID=UPI0021C24AF7|nr:DUF6182 family protein [Planotetraspora sp. A-T 1434]MCT9935141.1 DUF6182 family protein [Planotetraspora sp. A-T 1434]